MSTETVSHALVCYALSGAEGLCRCSSLDDRLDSEAVRVNTDAVRRVLEGLPAEAKRGDKFVATGSDRRAYLVEVRHAGWATAQIDIDGLACRSSMRLLLGRVRRTPVLRWVVLDAVPATTVTGRPYRVPNLLVTGEALNVMVGASDAPGSGGPGALLDGLVDGLAETAWDAIKYARPGGRSRVVLPRLGATQGLWPRRLGSRVVIDAGESQPE